MFAKGAAEARGVYLKKQAQAEAEAVHEKATLDSQQALDEDIGFAAYNLGLEDIAFSETQTRRCAGAARL